MECILFIPVRDMIMHKTDPAVMGAGE